jgi:tetratricopeptide (TPR) repeat protein
MKIAHVCSGPFTVMSQLSFSLTRSILLAIAGVGLSHCVVLPSRAQEASNKRVDSTRYTIFSKDPEERRQAQLRRDADMEERKHAQLQKAAEDVEKARADKDTNPNAFIQALTQAASIYQNHDETSKANEYFQQAVDFFNKLGDGRYNVRVFGMMQYALRYEPASTAIQTFGTLEEAAERCKLYDFRALDMELSNVISVWGGNRRFNHGLPNVDESRKLPELAWKKVIDVRTAVRGTNDHSLKAPLSNYAGACEANGDIGESEQSWLRVNALDHNNAILHGTSELNLADFYLRQKMFDKFETAWKEAITAEQGHISEGVARGFASLIENCKRLNRTADEQVIIIALLDKGGNSVVKALDPTLQSIVDGYIRSGDLTRAEALVKRRLQASATCTEDFTCNDWRLRLSDIYLSTGRKAESDKLFQQVSASLALQGISTETILQRRADLLQRLGMTAAAQKTRPTPRRSAGPIRVRFLLFAAQEIRLGHNTTIVSYDSSDPKSSFYGSKYPTGDASVCCLGTTRREGNFMMRGNGTIYGNVDPPTRSRPPFGAGSAPVPAGLAPIPPALTPPSSNVTDLRKNPAADLSTLKPGDYITDHLESRMFMRRDKGRLRFFIVDSDPPRSSVIDLNLPPINNNAPADFQIWYSGINKIRVNGLCGVVYAPNATVEIPFNGRVAGAIVANRIIGEGNNSYSFDTRLLETEFR